MIRQEDLQFHTPENPGEDWAETYWLGFFIPERNIQGFIYHVFRAGVGAVSSGIEISDCRSSRRTDAIYVDLQHHLRIPERLDKFALSNGVEFEAISPKQYHLKYTGVADTALDLKFEGLHEPYDIHDPEMDPMARADRGESTVHSGFGTSYANHFDLTTRVTGKARIRGEEFDINCLATIDHSWGPRPQRGMQFMGYINAQWDDGHVVNTIWDFDPALNPGEQHIFKHGYALQNGNLVGGLGGSIHSRRLGVFPMETTLEMRDADNKTHTFIGRPKSYTNWVNYGHCETAMAMMEWSRDGGKTFDGYGSSMEGFPLDAATGGYLNGDFAITEGTKVNAEVEVV